MSVVVWRVTGLDDSGRVSSLVVLATWANPSLFSRELQNDTSMAGHVQALLMSRSGVGTQIIISASFCQAKKVSKNLPSFRSEISPLSPNGRGHKVVCQRACARERGEAGPLCRESFPLLTTESYCCA